MGKGKSHTLIKNRLMVLGSGPHTPPNFFASALFPRVKMYTEICRSKHNHSSNHSFYFCLYVNYPSQKQNSAYVGCKTGHISCLTVFSWASAITDISTRNAEMKSIYQTFFKQTPLQEPICLKKDVARFSLTIQQTGAHLFLDLKALRDFPC